MAPRLATLFGALLLAALPFTDATPCKKRAATSTTASLTTASSTISVPIVNPDAKNIVPNSYIVVYNNTFDDDAIDAHQLSIKNLIQKRNLGKRDWTGKLLSTDVFTFQLNTWRAMALETDDIMATEINNADEVSYIEANTYVNATALVDQTNAPTGLIRLSHAQSQGTSTTAGYIFDTSGGQGITAYVVDTGIYTEHEEFGGRAYMAANFVNSVNTDENGHGSHVAGTIGGATYGVAKNVRLFGVKVLDASGGGTNSGVLQGLEFVHNNATAMGLGGKAIMNMSFGGSESASVNEAVAAIVAANIVPIVAAGNDNEDASNLSPAMVADAITVGAIDQTTDEKASFSNYGAVVDVFAPGVNVVSVGISSTTATQVLSGTSMACPHVAGLAAYLMALDNLSTVSAVTAKIKALATATGAYVKDNAAGTTSLIANNGNL